MKYPSIRQYTETIKLAAKAPEDYFDKLSDFLPVLDFNGNPIMSSGNFAVVFKMYNPKNLKYYALKCFHREQEKRNEYYQLISEELNKTFKNYQYGTQNISSSFLIHTQYYDKELFVDMEGDHNIFPVLLMEWIDGVTLDTYIRQHLDNKRLLQSLTYRFSSMAKWLLSQQFAHGDLKPDNILVRNDGSLVLVDYDGMYVPAMKGRKSLELGSPNFRHPQRTENDFNENMDDFSIVIILLSLKAISLVPYLYGKYATGDKLLFEEKDYLSIEKNTVIPLLNQYLRDNQLANLLGLFLIMLNCRYFPKNINKLIDLQAQSGIVDNTYSENEVKEKILHFFKSIDFSPPNIIYLIPDMFHEGIREYWLPKSLWTTCKVETVMWNEDSYKSIFRYRVEYDAIMYSIVGEFSKKSRPNIMFMNGYNHNKYLVDYTYNILFEMGVDNYFTENVDKLATIVNKNKKRYNFNREDLPF